MGWGATSASASSSAPVPALALARTTPASSDACGGDFAVASDSKTPTRTPCLPRLLLLDSDSEPAEEEAKRTRLAGQAVVAAPAGKEVYEEEEVSEEEEDEEDEEEDVEEDEEEEVASALFPGGEDGVDRLWNDIKAASFPGGGDNHARDKMDYHMDKLVKALYDTKDVELRQRNAAAHLAYLLGTRPVAAPDGKGTAFYRLLETGSFLWTS